MIADPRVDVTSAPSPAGDPPAYVCRPSRDLLRLMLAAVLFGTYASRIEDALGLADQLLTKGGVPVAAPPANPEVVAPPAAGG